MPPKIAQRLFASRLSRAAEGFAHYAGEVAPALRRHLERLSDVPWAEQRILDIGCGYRYPIVALLYGQVRSIAGVDISCYWRDGWATRYKEERGKGILRAALVTARDRLSDAMFWRCYRAAGIPLFHSAYDLRIYDGKTLPFADGAFTSVVSNAVVEHVDDLEAFAAETARVLAPGGVANHLWHNFYSLSGSHLPEAEYSAVPWGHLTGQLTSRSALHPRMPEEVSAAFAGHFEVVAVKRADRAHRTEGTDPGFEEEGAELLPEALSRAPELERYPRDLLLTRAYVIQMRKETGAPSRG